MQHRALMTKDSVEAADSPLFILYITESRARATFQPLLQHCPSEFTMVSASFVLLGALALVVSTVDGKAEFVQRLPNGANVKGYEAIGHTDGTGNNDATNAFGNAFEKAGNKWTATLCQADTDGDGQTNGQELGDPCCVWTQSSAPRWTTGVSHPSLKESTSDATLWANINCSADTSASSAASATNSGTTTSTTNTTGSGTSDASSYKTAQSLISSLALASSIALYLA